MSAAYISSIMENAPDTIHVYDKFHVVEKVTEAVYKVHCSLRNQEKDQGQCKTIKGSRWLLLTKDKDKFDEFTKNRLEDILNTNEPPLKTYYLKENLDQIL